MRRGFLIVLEGVDGTGKSTQGRLLAEALEEKGYRVVLTREPSSGRTGRKIREYLTGETRHLSAEEELELFMADRREHVETVIRPALEQGFMVISDRYYFSSGAYQGALGLDPAWILAENETFAPPPDLVILFTLPTSLALARRRGRPGQLSESPEYLEEVAAIYDSFQRPYLHRVDASGAKATTHARVLELTLKALKDRGGGPDRRAP